MICPETGTRCELSGCTIYINGRCGRLSTLLTRSAAPGETPRTAAATFEILSSLQSGTDKVVHAHVAEQLERELSEARAALARWRCADCGETFDDFDSLTPHYFNNCPARGERR